MTRESIFISYSRRDSHLVRPVANLLRATSDWVFVDQDSIRPGSDWREQIEKAIRSANLLVVFWCHHSAESEEVSREVEIGLSNGKRLVPVLLDATPLPEHLGAYQAVDLSRLLRWRHLASVRSLVASVATVAAIGFVAAATLLAPEPIVLRGGDTIEMPMEFWPQGAVIAASGLLTILSACTLLIQRLTNGTASGRLSREIAGLIDG